MERKRTKALSLFADTSFILSAGDQVEANGNEPSTPASSRRRK
jgi:hypothetical protein